MTTITTVTTASKLADYYIWFANDVGSYLSNQKLKKLLIIRVKACAVMELSGSIQLSLMASGFPMKIS